MIITSVQNETIKKLIKLSQKKYRDEFNMFLIEGEHLIEEAHKANLKMTRIGLEGSDLLISENVAKKISTTKSGSSQFAVLDKIISPWVKGTRYLILDGIQDPGNMGTMIRSAHSFGFDAVIVSNDSVDIYNDKVIRASQGSLFHMPVYQMDLIEAIDRLENEWVKVYATALHVDAIALNHLNLSEAVAVVMGNEGQGVSGSIMERVKSRLKIETSQFESLNVAVAASIIAYHLRKE